MIFNTNDTGFQEIFKSSFAVFLKNIQAYFTISRDSRDTITPNWIVKQIDFFKWKNETFS